MRKVLLPIFALMLLAAVPAGPLSAQESFWTQAEAEELEDLFAALEAAPDQATARRIADDIWTVWTRPENPEAAGRVAEIMTAGTPAGQMRLMDELIADFPDYSEAWNLRATARFFRGDIEGSLEDIAKTLEREPRHFGALSGRAVIYLAEGRKEEALAAIRAALDVHPYLSERGLFPELADQ